MLSCHAAFQDRHEDTGLKTAYHSFQASAGMFTYINENFLHAPSTDLSRDTVKTLIAIMLAQAQEVFLEKQIADGKKAGLLAKLASQAAYLYTQALEGTQENVAKAVFERVWLLVVQVKLHFMTALAHYYQALADDDGNAHGNAITRLDIAQTSAREAARIANSIPSSPPPTSNLGSDTSSILADLAKKHITTCAELVVQLNKDNDFIYHQAIPAEAALPPIAKLPAAKAIPVSELYQGQDIQRIIGPDIFAKIVPMSVTESASLYDEEKAKLIRAESERVEVANDEMAASLDYLKLPNSLNILKGGLDQEMSVDEDFRKWCEDFVEHAPFAEAFEGLNKSKSGINTQLDAAMKSLDMEESVCEKMRNKYGGEWTQQPSSRLTSTLRSDLRNYRSAVEEASMSDAQLYATFRQFEGDMEEMRSAGETDEADVLYSRAMLKAGAARGGKGKGTEEGDLLGEIEDEGKESVAQLIAAVEDLLRKLQLVKRERQQTLKDLKDRVRAPILPEISEAELTETQIHTDDISSVLILNKKAISSQEAALFKSELEKFRPHQSRILQANHKQNSIMKELTRTYSALLSNPAVKAEQNKYESFSRQRASVLSKYRKVHQAFTDLIAGLDRARGFYAEMYDTVSSLAKNVDSFVNNRRSEGHQLLTQIEASKSAAGGVGADKEQARLKELMERMRVSPAVPSPLPSHGMPQPPPRPVAVQANSYHNAYNPATSPPATPGYGAHGAAPAPSLASPRGLPQQGQQSQQQQQQQSGAFAYNPHAYAQVQHGQQQPVASPPAHQQFFSPPPGQGYPVQSPPTSQYGQQQFGQPQGYGQQGYGQQSAYGQAQVPQGYIPPPPPPGPPPQQGYAYPGVGGHGHGQSSGQVQGQSNGGDPWAGLSAWK